MLQGLTQLDAIEAIETIDIDVIPRMLSKKNIILLFFWNFPVQVVRYRNTQQNPLKGKIERIGGGKFNWTGTNGSPG
jgi:hypothetical protein